jgi:hypothetical protein
MLQASAEILSIVRSEVSALQKEIYLKQGSKIINAERV